MINTPSQSVVAPSQQNKEPMFTTTASLDLLTLPEVADILRVARATVYRLVAKRKLLAFRISRRMRFKKQDVIAFVNDNGYGSQTR